MLNAELGGKIKSRPEGHLLPGLTEGMEFFLFLCLKSKMLSFSIGLLNAEDGGEFSPLWPGIETLKE